MLVAAGCGRTFLGQSDIATATDTDEGESAADGTSGGPVTTPDASGDPDPSIPTAGPTTIDPDTTPGETDTIGPLCGDEFVDPGEVCDGTQLLGQTCASQGFAGGELFCFPDCSRLDTSQCFGPGGCCEPNPGVGCEDPVCMGLVCEQDAFCCEDEWDAGCADAANFACPICAGGPEACGDGGIGRDEICDGGDLGGQSCLGLGFDGGSLGCLPTCDGFDPSDCFDYTGDCCEPNFTPGCDDDACVAVICPADQFCCDVEWDDICSNDAIVNCEVCEGAEFCGNNAIDGDDICDGTDLGGEDCTTHGFDRGVLGCLFDCSDFDTDGCVDYEGGCCFANGTPGCDDETCTVAVCLDDPTCCLLGWDTTCAAIAVTECSICTTPDVCGNSVHEPPEVCDGGDLDGEGCVSLGFVLGELSCAADCTSFDSSECVLSDCCVVHPSTGCDDALCEAAVCGVDDYCCDVTWDGICALEAEMFCPTLCPT